MKKPEAKPIITDEKLLDSRCKEIDTKTENKLVKEITTNLKTTMKKNNLKSLSAPAIGYNYRIFCIDSGLEIKTFINPVPYIDQKNKPTMQMALETCSSIPNKKYLRFRTDKISLMYQRPTGQPESKEFSGWLAVVIQHEIDHLEGIILSDFGLEIDDTWDELSEDEKSEVIMMYKDSLDLLSEKMNEEILKDPEAVELNNGIDYMTKVATGEIEVEGIK